MAYAGQEKRSTGTSRRVVCLGEPGIATILSIGFCHVTFSHNALGLWRPNQRILGKKKGSIGFNKSVSFRHITFFNIVFDWSFPLKHFHSFNYGGHFEDFFKNVSPMFHDVRDPWDRIIPAPSSINKWGEMQTWETIAKQYMYIFWFKLAKRAKKNKTMNRYKQCFWN